MAKKKKGIVYSTNPDFQYQYEGLDEQDSLSPNKQTLWVHFERKHRAGKKVTIVSGFAGNPDQLKALGKLLKTKCGVGGTVKDREILVQGDHREKVKWILKAEGYGVKG